MLPAGGERVGERFPVDYLVVGHVTHDLTPDGGHRIGGTAIYSGLTAAAYGRRVGIATSAGPDFQPPPLTSGVALVSSPGSATTTFENRYVEGERIQRVHAAAHRLALDAVPEAWRAAPIVHVGPVLGECDPSLVTHFYGKSFVGMTPQGWMRRVDDEGRVYGDAWLGAETLLPLASAVVVSIEDLRGSWDLARVWASQAELLAVTRGWEGATLFVGGEEHRLAAPDVLQVDPTGAGDIFAAVLFCALSEGWEPLAAARQAICVASQTVAREGLLGVPAAAEIGACHNRVSDEGR